MGIFGRQISLYFDDYCIFLGLIDGHHSNLMGIVSGNHTNLMGVLMDMHNSLMGFIH